VIDRKLYIDGGFINYNPLSQYPTNYSSECSSILASTCTAFPH
jgi:hypothetical protein